MVLTVDDHHCRLSVSTGDHCSRSPKWPFCANGKGVHCSVDRGDREDKEVEREDSYKNYKNMGFPKSVCITNHKFKQNNQKLLVIENEVIYMFAEEGEVSAKWEES